MPSPLRTGVANGISHVSDCKTAVGTSAISVAGIADVSGEPTRCGYHDVVGSVRSLSASAAASQTMIPQLGGTIASRNNRCHTVRVEPLSKVCGFAGSVVPAASKLLSESGTSGSSGAMLPALIHAIEPSAVVPPGAVLHGGSLKPDVPAPATLCVAPFGSSTDCPTAYAVAGCHGGGGVSNHRGLG